MPVYSNLVTTTHLREVELTFPSLRGGTVRNILDEFEKKKTTGGCPSQDIFKRIKIKKKKKPKRPPTADDLSS